MPLTMVEPDGVFCEQFERTVGNDNCIAFGSREGRLSTFHAAGGWKSPAPNIAQTPRDSRRRSRGADEGSYPNGA